MSTHSLRKTFIRAVYDLSNKDLALTARIAGHSSANLTFRYLESTQTEQDDVVLGLSGPRPAATVAPVLSLAS